MSSPLLCFLILVPLPPLRSSTSLWSSLPFVPPLLFTLFVLFSALLLWSPPFFLWVFLFSYIMVYFFTTLSPFLSTFSLVFLLNVLSFHFPCYTPSIVWTLSPPLPPSLISCSAIPWLCLLFLSVAFSSPFLLPHLFYLLLSLLLRLPLLSFSAWFI